VNRNRLYGLLLNPWLLLLGLALSLVLVWLSASTDPRVWSARNTLHYRLHRAFWDLTDPPAIQPTGWISGIVRGPGDQPLAGARVLVARWNGETFSALSDIDGHYTIPDIPAGRYKPVAGAPGYESKILGGHWGGVDIMPGGETFVRVELRPAAEQRVPPGSNLSLGEPVTLRCSSPVESYATRQSVSFRRNGGVNQPTLFYLPAGATGQEHYPVLLTVYPGPAGQWECPSIALAHAGYAVLAAGPDYSLDLESDVDELEQLLQFVRAGEIPASDPERVALLGGSYSALLTQRLAQRVPGFDAAVLLGPPTDLFDMRQRFEAGEFVPPFGLDALLIALGFPDRDPTFYWRYSSVYHVHGELPPVAIFHSLEDTIVPYQQSELLASALAEAGVEQELHLFHGATHYLLAGEEDARHIYELTLDFLSRYSQ
jgi:dipeptidyl aminopeptidase/acylaminoacyl peptidase